MLTLDGDDFDSDDDFGDGDDEFHQLYNVVAKAEDCVLLPPGRANDVRHGSTWIEIAGDRKIRGFVHNCGSV